MSYYDLSKLDQPLTDFKYSVTHTTGKEPEGHETLFLVADSFQSKYVNVGSVPSARARSVERELDQIINAARRLAGLKIYAP